MTRYSAPRMNMTAAYCRIAPSVEITWWKVVGCLFVPVDLEWCAAWFGVWGLGFGVWGLGFGAKGWQT